MKSLLDYSEIETNRNVVNNDKAPVILHTHKGTVVAKTVGQKKMFYIIFESKLNAFLNKSYYIFFYVFNVGHRFISQSRDDVHLLGTGGYIELFTYKPLV